MRKMTFLLSAVILTAGVYAAPSQAVDGLSANVGVTSNYVWRGMSQTSDQPAVSGGIDYETGTGFYVGAWASNVDFGLDIDSGLEDETSAEVDFYAGYAFDAGEVGIDVGYIFYGFPGCGECDASEIYASASWEVLTVGAFVTADSEAGADFGDDTYVYIDLAFEVAKDLELAFHYGLASFDGGGDQSDYGVSLSKDNFTFSITDVDDNAVEPNMLFAVSYSVDFDL